MSSDADAAQLLPAVGGIRRRQHTHARPALPVAACSARLLHRLLQLQQPPLQCLLCCLVDCPWSLVSSLRSASVACAAPPQHW